MKTFTMSLSSDSKEVTIIEDGRSAQFEYTIPRDQLMVFENRNTDEARVFSRGSCIKRTFFKPKPEEEVTKITRRVLAKGGKSEEAGKSPEKDKHTNSNSKTKYATHTKSLTKTNTATFTGTATKTFTKTNSCNFFNSMISCFNICCNNAYGAGPCA